MVKNLLAAVGCLTILALAAGAAVRYQEQLRGVYRSFGKRTERVADSGADEARPALRGELREGVGVPSAAALRRAAEKEAAIGHPRGPGYVVLSADELASLIDDRLATGVGRRWDSLRVRLQHDRLVLEGLMMLDRLVGELPGPLSEWLGGREPVRIGGPVEVRSPGALSWKVDEFVIREFPFPGGVIPRLVRRLGGDTTGAFPIAVPATVGEVHVSPEGATFYRMVR